MPSGGELSKTTRAGPTSLVACPERPSFAPERPLVDRHRLDHGALRHPLGELVAPAPAAAGRRRCARPGSAAPRRSPAAPVQAALASRPVGVEDDAAGAVLDPPHRGAEPQPLAPELLGQQQRQSLRAAVEAVLLGAALGPDQRVEAAAGVRVEEDVEQRDVARLRRPDRLGGELEQVPGARRPGVAADPGGERLGVPLARLRGLPGRLRGTCRAIRSSRARACSKSTSASGETARARSLTSVTRASVRAPR